MRGNAKCSHKSDICDDFQSQTLIIQPPTLPNLVGAQHYNNNNYYGASKGIFYLVR